MKYIFVAGAPGSKWSSVVKNIYYSPSVDRSDYRDHWTYYRDAPGGRQLLHFGAYFDPEMECNLPEYFNGTPVREAKKIFDQPFTDTLTENKRIIKSHVFSYKENIDYLRHNFPDCPIVLVYRPSDACLGWWVKAGHFDITYPNYSGYYKDLGTMASIIEKQNAGIIAASTAYKATQVYNNTRLAMILGLKTPSEEYNQNYIDSDVEVKVIL